MTIEEASGVLEWMKTHEMPMQGQDELQPMVDCYWQMEGGKARLTCKIMIDLPLETALGTMPRLEYASGERARI